MRAECLRDVFSTKEQENNSCECHWEPCGTTAQSGDCPRGSGEALPAGVRAGPGARARADAAAASLPRGLPRARAPVQTARASPSGFPRGISPEDHDSLGFPSHWLPTAAPCPFHPSSATRTGGRRNLESRHHVGAGRAEAACAQVVCAEAVCAGAARASPGLGARNFNGKFSGDLLRLRGVGHAPSRPVASAWVPPSPGEQPRLSLLRKLRPPRGNRCVSSALPGETAGHTLALTSPELRAPARAPARRPHVWPPGILRGASAFASRAPWPQPRHLPSTRVPHLLHGAGQREEQPVGVGGWGSPRGPTVAGSDLDHTHTPPGK